MPDAIGNAAEPRARDIVVKGGFPTVNRYFVEHEYSDGLPTIPPTPGNIDAFLHYPDRDPQKGRGHLLPDQRAATIWSIAANGVMA